MQKKSVLDGKPSKIGDDTPAKYQLLAIVRTRILPDLCFRNDRF